MTWGVEALPDRSVAARARLAEVGRQARPVTLARDRVLTVGGVLAGVLPGGALRRGATVVVAGAPGAGATTLALSLAAAATAAGEWAGAVDLDGTIGGEAAAAAGVALDRFAVARRVPPARWATVVAVLLEGLGLVVAEVPPHARVGDARRLVARARERGSVLVALERPCAAWPADATLRLRATGGAWPGLGAGEGTLGARELRVQAGELSEVARRVRPALARAG